MPIEREKIRAALLKKGFRQKDGDHCYFHLYTDGKKRSVFTYLSHGSGYKVYDDELVHRVAQEIGLTNKEFKDFIDCPLSHEEHIKLLKQRNRLR